MPSAGDILQGLALMDATAGDGDPFWELYAEHLLPPPEEVTLPMAWGPELLQQLQHDAIQQGAQAQQVRATGREASKQTRKQASRPAVGCGRCCIVRNASSLESC